MQPIKLTNEVVIMKSTNKSDTEKALHYAGIKNYQIRENDNGDLVVDVYEDVDVSRRRSEWLPVKFGRVKCEYNFLTSSDDFPEFVSGTIKYGNNEYREGSVCNTIVMGEKEPNISLYDLRTQWIKACHDYDNAVDMINVLHKGNDPIKLAGVQKYAMEKKIEVMTILQEVEDRRAAMITVRNA